MGDFLNKIKRNMDKYIETASIKTCEIADTTRIRLEILGLNKEKREMLLNLGKTVHKMYLKGRINEEKIAERCEEIIRLDREIKLKEEEMDRVRGKGLKYYKEYNGKKKYINRDLGEDKTAENREEKEEKGTE